MSYLYKIFGLLGWLFLLSIGGLKAQSYHDLNKNGRMDPYENPKLAVSQRVDDLMAQMTLEEKVGQLQMTMGWEYYDKSGNTFVLTEAFREAVVERHVGNLWAVMRADPWTQKSLQNGIPKEQSYQLSCEMQRYVREHTRLGIPLMLAEECPHGHMALGSKVFPTAIGRASSFNADLEYRIGEQVGRETRLQGAQIAFGPVLDVTRDPRWSRFEEGYGEDPVLSAVLGTQYALGLQSQHLISTLKHFTAHGVSEGGHNGFSAQVGSREVLSVLSLPFQRALASGVASIMTSYNDVDGIPCSANQWLLQDVLRKQWNFNGLVISDLFAINGLVSARMASDYKEAAVLAIRAGVNIDLGASCYSQPLLDAVTQGLLTMQEVDEALRPVLTAKFNLGLFDYDFEPINQDFRMSDYTLQSAQESVVLLKNDGTLPLSKKIKRIAVVGPNADNVYNMLGDYTAPQAPGDVITVLQGILEKVPKQNVEYVKGCHIRDTSWAEIDRAMEVANRADVVIVAMGGSSARDFNTVYEQTGAANSQTPVVNDMDAGEGFDRASIQMLGYQNELLQALVATGKPVVLVMIQGRPLDISWADSHVSAILNAWYPGAQGGRAIADILFGDVNPSAKLPISYPKSLGQLPVYYNSVDERRNYTDASAQPLYPFGYGLSYTTFEYGLPSTPVWINDTILEVNVPVTNTGNYDGAEVIQLYVRDELASVKLPDHQLKAFQKVFLKKGETQMVTFHLPKSDFALMDARLQWTVEQGTFTLLIGSSNADIKYNLNVEVK